MNLISLRDYIWEYPNLLFVGENSLFGGFITFFYNTRPFSYVVSTLIVGLSIGAFVVSEVQTALSFDTDTYIEGVIVGANAAGEPRGPQKLNPVEVSNSQLDRDIMQLIYEPMIRVQQDDEVEKVLATDFAAEDQEGTSYRFKLREGVKWHDGTEFTAKDVEATFNLIKELTSSGVPDIVGGSALTNIDIKVLDNHLVVFKINDQILPNFYELMTFDILPAHLISQYKQAILKGRYTGAEELQAVGTGPYLLRNIAPDNVTLEANTSYYKETPKIKEFKFKLLIDIESAEKAIRSGEIHGITNVDRKFVRAVNNLANIDIKDSNVIYTQYWAAYFNLSDKGPAEFKNLSVRKAITMAVNKELAIKSILDHAEVTNGPIPVNSQYYSAKHQQPDYDPDEAMKLLSKEGWRLTSADINGEIVKLQEKNGKYLEFDLVYVNNSDREQLIASLTSDLQAIGIKVNPIAVEPAQLSNIRSQQEFDLILLGVKTFVDPDRYEFLHSSQIPGKGDGNNIGSYKSQKLWTVLTQNKDTERIPHSDYLLDKARKSSIISERKTTYAEFQELIASDIPAVFLYHPTIRYVLNKRVKNVQLDQVQLLEDRFNRVYLWEINYDN